MMWFAHFRCKSPWREILQATLYEVNDDRCTSLAAQVAFYALLSLFPALLFLFALVGYLPFDDLLSALLLEVGAVAPHELITLLRRQLDALTAGSHRNVLTLGVVGALWSSG